MTSELNQFYTYLLFLTLFQEKIKNKIENIVNVERKINFIDLTKYFNK